MADQARLALMERGFHPRNIAVIGAARHNNFGWLRRHLPFQERGLGKVFHVNIDKNEWPGAEALGIRAFSSMLDIPEPVDYVSVSVPPKVTPLVFGDCVKKGVAVVHFFTAGFGDAGTPEGVALEETISKMLGKSGTLLIGPNCVGLYDPVQGIRQGENQRIGEAGSLSCVGHSGTQSMAMVAAAEENGIKINKCISMGNGIDLDMNDYIDYLAQDKDTRAITLYVEGVRHPRKFFQSIKEAASKKPVLVWKVGTTEDAARATGAHTGSPYMPDEQWNSLLLRSGGIRVDGLEDMMSTVKLLLELPPAFRYRAGLVALSGGHSTEMANVFSRAGLQVPALTSKSYEELQSFFNVVGGSYRNPMEGGGMGNPETFKRALRILVNDANIDLVAVEMPASRSDRDPSFLDGRIQAIKELKAQTTKPIMAVLTTTFPYSISVDERIPKRLNQEGIAACLGFEGAANALKKMVDYHLMKSYLGD